MKKYTLLPLLLALSLLTGCGSLLERSYTAVTPHTQFSDESKNDAILRAETYQGLVSALLYLVEQGEETGTVRLYQYGQRHRAPPPATWIRPAWRSPRRTPWELTRWTISSTM